MSQPDPLRDLELLIRSRHSILLLDTAEEERAEVLLKHLADRLELPLFSWTPTRGLRRVDLENPVYNTTEALQALDHAEQAQIPALYHFRGLGGLLGNLVLGEKLRDAAAQFRERTGALILTGTGIELPESLRPMSATLRLPAPRPEEYRSLLQHIVRDLSARRPVEIELTREELNRLLVNLQGLTLLEAEKILTRVIIEDGRLSPEDLRAVVETKTAVVEREGLLEYYPVEESMAEVAGLEGLKGWLAKRRMILADPERARQYGLPFPKGVLLLGVPGCGKSHSAKAVSMEWGLPLLKFDPAGLYNKYIGETERNFKRAIGTAEKLAPVILWIDEIEKAFASSGEGEDGGVSRRLLGSFLSWLQERGGDVFVVATANDVTRLPPELLRKGRFDEVFFVDLPEAPARRAIFEIHLRRRGQDPARFDLPRLVEATEGFSGAEIEQVIVSGLYTAFASHGELSDRILLEEIAATRPLSRVMPERIAALREWARERTVAA
ncbi:AAA family ATPase [soil metagenome]